MRLLLVNPNTTAAVTDLLMAAAAPVANPGTRIVPLTADRGVPYIASRAEAQIAGAQLLETLAEHAPAADAAIVAAFGDPGLMAARELFDIPVIGMAEAAMLTACLLGRRFGIVTFAAALSPWFEECVALHGLGTRCAGIRTLDGTFRSLAEVQSEKAELLVALANRAVEQDGADVVILAGAPLAGLAGKVAQRVPVPLIDPIAAAVKQAEAVFALAPRPPRAGSFARPGGKASTGLPPALAARIAGQG